MKRKRNKTTEPEECRGKEKQRKLEKKERQTNVEKKNKSRHKDREMRITQDQMLSSQQDQEARVDQDQALCKKQNRVTRNDRERTRHIQQDRATKISHAQVVINRQDRAAWINEDQTITNSRQEEEENPVVQEFHAVVDAILEATSDVDLAEIMENDAEDEDISALFSSSESLLDGSLLKSVSLASGRLKCCGLTNKVPCKRLVQLLKVLHLCLKMGNVVLPASEVESDITEDSSTDREAVITRLLSSLDASLAILNIMTSADMPKMVYLEDVILRVVKIAKAQLESTLYPQFDPMYNTDQQFVRGRSTLKSKKSKDATVVRDKSVLQMYASLTQIVTLLSDLVDVQELTDTVVLEASSLAVSPFLVENVHELQLVALKLTYRIFSRYEKHQQLILEDILSVLAKLPCNKKNVKTYKISGSSVQVQMLTALTLQLVQSVVKLPRETRDNSDQDNKETSPEMADAMANLLLSYEKALKTAHVFLSLFLSKCTTKSEDDYRPLFENFVMDLLEMAHHPGWPAVEPVLILLSNLLVKQFGTRTIDMTARVAALGYLGLIAARLRKDVATNHGDVGIVSQILAQQGHQNSDTGQKMICLQKRLLNYLAAKSETDSSLDFSRQFYMAQWCSDHFRTTSSSAAIQTVKSSNGLSKEITAKLKNSNGLPKEITAKLKNSNGLSKEITAKLIYPTYLSLSTNTYLSTEETLSSDSAMAVARYLAAHHAFSQCADICLMQILLILGETTTAIRSKAMKCLAGVIEADPKILSKAEVQEAVHGRCLDQSTSVRDAAVDLIGRNILQHQQLIDTYYGMLSERILDTGISVRKRVIAIFRDICVRYPTYPRVPDMCVQMIRRIGDEDGVKKLVTETFESMWFTHLHRSDTSAIKQCVDNIVSVVAACQHSSFFDWLEQLISNMLKKGKESRNGAITTTCQLIVSGLVQNAVLLMEQIKVEGGSATTDCSRLVACFSALYIFCKVKPEFLIPHCSDLHVYLDYDIMPQMDSVIRHHAIHILEMVLPLLIKPDEGLLTLIEGYLMKLILSQGMLIVQRSFSCLATLIKSVTHNYEPVQCYFQRFFRLLVYLTMEHKNNSSNSVLKTSQPMLLRSLFIVGLLCEHFVCEDFDEDVEGLSDRIFHTLFYFTHHEVEEVQHKALTAIGHMAIRHSDFMLGKTLKDLYIQLLTDSGSSVRLCCQVLKNIQMYLAEEEAKMMKADKRWKDMRDQISLKEMADIQSGMASAIIQIYLKHVLELFFSADIGVRSVALDVITTVLHQGLIHPAQCVPYLICLGSDCDPAISHKADHWLKEIDKKYPGFIQMKALQGIRLSYQLHQKLQGSAAEPIRGLRPTSKPSCLNSYVYTLLRTNRGQRRFFLNSLLKLFNDTQDTELRELVYVADCFSGFPFQQLDEVLFVIHQLDAIVSISGSNVLQSYTKIFYPNEEDRVKMEDEDVEEDLDSLLDCLPKDVSRLKRLYVTSMRYHLLLILKKHLKSTYGISDKTIQQYSPADGAKLYDKPLNVKNNAKFNPTTAIDVLKQPDVSRTELVEAYLNFKDLMMTIDTAAEKEDSASQVQSGGMSLACCSTVES